MVCRTGSKENKKPPSNNAPDLLFISAPSENSEQGRRSRWSSTTVRINSSQEPPISSVHLSVDLASGSVDVIYNFQVHPNWGRASSLELPVVHPAAAVSGFLSTRNWLSGITNSVWPQFKQTNSSGKSRCGVYQDCSIPKMEGNLRYQLGPLV
jgi:hypothetical protein